MVGVFSITNGFWSARCTESEFFLAACFFSRGLDGNC
jgi:hypothetical protein